LAGKNLPINGGVLGECFSRIVYLHKRSMKLS
jgi:hypothetical protein